MKEIIVQSHKNIDNIISLLKEKGIAVIPDYLNAGQVKRSLLEFEQLLNIGQTHFSYPIDYSPGQGTKVMLEKIDETKFATTSEIFNNSFFYKVAENYFNQVFSLNKEVFVVKDVVGSNHHANDLHFDVKNTLKFFIYLNDTTIRNGAFYCTPGSHKWTQRLRRTQSQSVSYDNREFTRKLSDEYGEPVPIEGKAGTLIVFDTDVFHKAGKVSIGERKVMRGHTRLIAQSVTKLSIFQRIKKKMGF